MIGTSTMPRPSAALAHCAIRSIEAGNVADLTIWRVPSHTQIPYWPGAGLVRTVIKRGRLVYQRA